MTESLQRVGATERLHIVLGRPDPTGCLRKMQVDVESFEIIADLHHDLSGHSDREVVLDLTHIGWVDGHLTAALDIVFRRAARDGNVVRLAGMKPRLRSTFCKNGLIIDRKADRFNTIMPLAAFRAGQESAFSAYTKRFLDRPEMPTMTSSLRGRFFEGIDELFANATLHARSALPIIVSGQYFPRAGQLSFCIADGGDGMRRAVSGRLDRPLSATEAIAWAMEPFNTTRQGDIPGGLGSQVVREFIEANGGRMTVVSNEGFWTQSGHKVFQDRLTSPFPGTAIVIEINAACGRSYDAPEAPAAENIW